MPVSVKRFLPNSTGTDSFGETLSSPAMSDTEAATIRHFVTYSGFRPPARLVDPLEPHELANRNTFIRARYDDGDRLIGFEKMVYGAVELAHVYAYHPSGRLKSARITMDGDETVLAFDDDGRPVG